MSKKGKQGAGWIVTFADLMALLLTFFVLLFSFSTIDAKKFEAMAGSLKSAFSYHPLNVLGKRGETGTGGTPIGIVISLPSPPLPPPEPKREEGPKKKQGPKPKSGMAQVQVSPRPAPTKIPTPPARSGFAPKNLHDRLAVLLERQISGGGAALIARRGAVIIRFDEKVTFATGSAKLVPSFKVIIGRIASLIEKSQGRIVVSGHTDDRPIATSQFRSNWDLSAARAVSVVHYLLSTTDLRPNRIVAQGRADSVPLFANDSENHRAKNRRVEIRIVQMAASKKAK